MDVLQTLMKFYVENCDGDWEHGLGVKIDTIDNPGWSLKIDLLDTNLSDKSFEKVSIDRSESDWIHCWVKDNVFEGASGANNLSEMLSIFTEWYLSTHDKD